jgi:SpoIIAA-like
VIEQLSDLPEDVLGFEAKGDVSGDDYERVLVPAVEKRLAQVDKISLLYVLGDEFNGYSAAAAWDDTKVGMQHLSAWKRIAVVTDHEFYRHAIKGFGFLMRAEVKVFANSELAEARAWVSES